MMNEQELRDRLGTVDVPPTRLQVNDLVDAGRRRALRRRGIQAGCGVALATGLLVTVPSLVFGAGGPAPAPAPAAASADCAATKLPVPAGMKSVTADAVDPTGKYIIGNNRLRAQPSQSLKADTIDITQPVLWTDGQPQALPVVGKSTSASAVNAGGVVVALSGDKKFNTVIRYVDGVPEKLKAPPGEWIFQAPLSINARGDILANATHKNTPEGKVTVLLWKAGSGTAKKLPLPAGASGHDITDNGTIVGEVLTGSQIDDLSSYVWNEQGTGHKLKAPTGQTAAVNSARGDWATGNLWPSGTAARWNLRTGEVTDLKIHAPASAVNAQGWIITDGALQRDGKTVSLGTADGVKGEPMDLSDNGLVVGSLLSYDKDAATVSDGALTWQCGG